MGTAIMTRVSLVALAGKTSQGEEEEKVEKEGRGRRGNDTSGTSSHNSCCMPEEGRGEGTEKDEGLWRVTE